MFKYYAVLYRIMNTYLLGLLAGDGARYLGKKGRYMVWIDQQVKNLKILEKAKQILEALGLNVFFYAVPGNKKRVLVYSKKLFEEFSRMMENLPDFFNSLTEDGKKEFIAGFLDAEGTITDRIVIYNKNRKLLESIKGFLTKLGVKSYIYQFGKVFGLQIYKRESIAILKKEIKGSIKLSPLPG